MAEAQSIGAVHTGAIIPTVPATVTSLQQQPPAQGYDFFQTAPNAGADTGSQARGQAGAPPKGQQVKGKLRGAWRPPLRFVGRGGTDDSSRVGKSR